MNPMPPEAQVAGFVDRYTPEMALAVRAARRQLRALFPRGFELVFDNYNALVFGYGPSEKASEALISIAAYPRWIAPLFNRFTPLDELVGSAQVNQERPAWPAAGQRHAGAGRGAEPGGSAGRLPRARADR
jgi:hypothetical protein